MDESWLLDEPLTEEDVVCAELLAVVPCVLDEGVTVTVTVDFGPLLQSEALWDVSGAAAASPKREERKILECILSRGSRVQRLC